MKKKPGDTPSATLIIEYHKSPFVFRNILFEWCFFGFLGYFSIELFIVTRPISMPIDSDFSKAHRRIKNL